MTEHVSATRRERKIADFKVGTFINDLEAGGWGGAVLQGVGVTCPYCRRFFSMSRDAVARLAGQARHCPYCDRQASLPANPGSFRDIRPSRGED